MLLVSVNGAVHKVRHAIFDQFWPQNTYVTTEN